MNKAGFSQNGQLNVAVAGLGWWGKVIIEALKDNPKIRVVKTIDPIPAAGEWAKTQGLDFATDYNVALADPKVGGVILCLSLIHIYVTWADIDWLPAWVAYLAHI